MRYIKTYDNYKPVTVNSEKPFQIDDKIDDKIRFLLDKIKSLRIRMDNPKRKRDRLAHSKMNDEKNKSIQKLKELQHKKARQQAYLKENPPIKESVEEKKNLIFNLESDNFEPDDIIKLIGLDENEYEIPTTYKWGDGGYIPDYDEDGFTIYMNSTKLEDLMGVDKGIVNHLLSFNFYNQNEYYVDDDELNYLQNYFPKELNEKFKKLGKIFNYELEVDSDGDIKDGEIYDLLNYLSLDDELEELKSEIAMENERAIEAAANDIVGSLPFSLSHSNNRKFDIQLDFEYEKIIKYIKDKSLDVKTIKDFLEKFDSSDLRYEFEYEDKYEFLGYFKDLIVAANNIVDKFIEWPDEVFPKMIKNNNLVAFKDNIKLAEFSSKYDLWINYKRFSLNLFEIARKVKFPNILEYLNSEEFRNFINSNGDEYEKEAYDNFMMKENVDKFNL